MTAPTPQDAPAFSPPAPAAALERRTAELFAQRYDAVARRTDRMFVWLMLGQWLAAIGFAVWLSPFAWAGKLSAIHAHVYLAILLGGVLTSLPVALAILRPGKPSTRYVIACGQMLWSALLIHLTGGRIETHFHVFGSLAFIAFYRDYKVLIPASIVVLLDHLLRAFFWPESVFGVSSPEWWRAFEHGGWVIFIDVFLVMNCLQSRRELLQSCRQRAELENAHENQVRVERLAAVGKLAASVGHELRNPLSAIRNAHTIVERRFAKADTADEKISKFLGIIDRELDASTKIISNLMDFSRTREPKKSPCVLRSLVEEAVQVVPERAHVRIENAVPPDLPLLPIDRDQFRQVLVNIAQNAAESIPAERAGAVTVSADVVPGNWCRITIRDNGAGMPDEVKEKIFQPLFSTKTKGTGLGLAVVWEIVSRHGGQMAVDSRIEVGTTFAIDIPCEAAPARPPVPTA